MNSVVIIGRRNVGKSTLFNRLLQKPRAIVSALPGTTRDRLSDLCTWQGQTFELIDTGGLDLKQPGELERNIKRQAELAIKKADLILLIVDAQTGPTKEDRQLIKYLKPPLSRPIILVINKADNESLRLSATNDFYQLGLKDLIAVSALNGSGTGDLLDLISQKLPAKKTVERDLGIKVAIIGKPNVGKSSLVNSLCGEERMIVTPTPHTTRDSQDITLQYQRQNITLIDTAGIRRQALKTKIILEEPSIKKAKAALHQADLALLILEINQSLTFQDRHLAELINQERKGLIIIANKIDLLPEFSPEGQRKYRRYIAAQFPFLSWAPIVFVSATEKKGLKSIFKNILKTNQEQSKFLIPEELDSILQKVQTSFKKSRKKSQKGKWAKFLALKQIAIKPPTFYLQMAQSGHAPKQTIFRLEKSLREEFSFFGTPIIIKIVK